LGDELDDRGVPPLIRALSDRAESVQEAAIQALKKIGDSVAVDALVHCFFKGSAAVRWRAAQALKALRWRPDSVEEQIQWFITNGEFNMLSSFGVAAVQPLAAALDSPAFEQRVAIVAVLEQLEDRSVEKPLLRALLDEHPSVRTAAANALARFPDTNVVAAVIRTLGDPERNVREAAANSLGKLGDPAAVNPLIRLIEDKCWEVRTAALEALGRLGDSRASQPIAERMQDDNEDVRQSAVQAVGSVGDDSILEKLVMTLVDDNISVRGAATRALYKLCPEWESSERVKKLLPALKAELKGRQANTQFAATGLLKRIGGLDAADGLMAEIALASTSVSLDKKTAVSTAILRELLNDPDTTLRFAGELASPASGHAINLAASLPAAERPDLTELVIYTAGGDVLHDWPPGAAKQRIKLAQLVKDQASRLTREIHLGDFNRLLVGTATEHMVVKASENGVALVRSLLPGAAPVPPTEPGPPVFPLALSAETREAITHWLYTAPSTRGVFLRGLRFADKTFVGDLDSQLYPTSSLEHLYGAVAEVFLALRQHSPLQISWIFSRTAVHFTRRPDASILGAFAYTKMTAEDLLELAQRFAEFRGL
jgi:HEAT repeat protein